ncbi:MAG: CBS domain-containing protein [Pelagimonas sp.]|jgi:CBS domain-containing protein|nr:CBS domain-containing protein [Pelagimonas sp.]
MTITSIGQLIAGRPLISVTPECTAEQACKLFSEHRIGALAVVDQGALVGILCERDVIRRCIAQERAPAQTPVREVMTQNPTAVSQSDGLAHAQTVMDQGAFRHLPVVDDAHHAVGMISVRDIPTDYKVMAERFQEYQKPV